MIDPKKFRRYADTIAEDIDNKRGTPLLDKKVTRRRVGIILSLLRAANRLEKIQIALLALADAAENDCLPQPLIDIRYKTDVEKLIDQMILYPEDETEETAALRSIADFPDRSEDIESLRSELDVMLHVGQIPGFYPTPLPIIEKILDLSDIIDGMNVLEPSAGSGSIAEVLRSRYDINLSVIEINHTLADLLKSKGFDLIHRDFLSYSECRWDRILMNPPFENAQDVEHIHHAFKCLLPGGRLVSVLGRSSRLAYKETAKRFHKWLKENTFFRFHDLGGTFEPYTSVKADLLVINKPKTRIDFYEVRGNISEECADAWRSVERLYREGLPTLDYEPYCEALVHALSFHKPTGDAYSDKILWSFNEVRRKSSYWLNAKAGDSDWGMEARFELAVRRHFGQNCFFERLGSTYEVRQVNMFDV
jgi:methylase of polypeptide subunit release factors